MHPALKTALFGVLCVVFARPAFAAEEEDKCTRALKPPMVPQGTLNRLARPHGVNQDQRILQDLHEKFGWIFRIRNPNFFPSYVPGAEWIPGEGTDVFINDKSAMAVILKNTDVMARDWSFLKPFAGPNSMVLKDMTKPEGKDAWKVAHDLMIPFFTPVAMNKKMSDLRAIISGEVEEYLSSHEHTIKLNEFSFFVSYATTVHFLFGAAPSFEQVQPLRKTLEGQFDPDVDLTYKGRILREKVNEVMAWNESHATPGSLYSALKAVQIREDLSPNWLRDQMRTLIAGGFETTQALIGAMLYEIGQRPEWATRLRQASIGSNGEQPLYRVKDYLAFMNETLRLYPSVPGIIRVARQNFVVNGKLIEQGSRVFQNVYSLHRTGWGETAGGFNPDRTDPQGCTMDRTTSMMAFGDGPQVCIGQFMARGMAALSADELLRRFDIFTRDVQGEPFSYPSTMRIDPEVALTLRPR